MTAKDALIAKIVMVVGIVNHAQEAKVLLMQLM